MAANAEEPAKEGEAAPAEVSYYRDIRPIFQANCQGCHQPAKQGGEYEMTEFASLINGGETGEAAVVPGKPEESYLVQQITPENGEAAMPKEKPPLAESDIAKITLWIKQGAKDDTPASTRPQYDMEHPPTYTMPPVITALDYSPDGKLLAVSGYHEVLLHKADGSGIEARLVGMSERIESVAFSPDGKKLAVTGGSPGRMGEVQIWDVEKRALLLSLPVGYDTAYGGSWSPDGKLVSFGCPDATVRAIEAEGGKQVLFNGAHSDWVLDTTFSAQGDHVVSVSRDMSMKLINVPTQRFIDNITSITPGALKGGLHSVDRHPTKDELLIGGADGIPKIYKMVREQARQIGDDFNKIREFPGLPGRLFDVQFSADGNRIVAGSSLDGGGEVRVYEAADGKQVARSEIKTSGVFSVAFQPDGQAVAAGGYDGKIRLIDVATGNVKQEFYPVPLETEVAATQ
jgi:WD40 repeat protein/mono/diheme cytochrome c family protein